MTDRFRFDFEWLSAGDFHSDEPVTTAKTARQTFQRAFAQELLCPWSDLIAFLDSEEPDEEDIEDAADYFSVSPLLVKAALVDRGQLNRERLVGRSLVFELLI